MKKVMSLLSAVFLMLMMSNVFAETTMQDVKNNASDTTITTKIKSLLLKDQFVGDTANTLTVHVETTNGVVHLTGHVKSDTDKKKAVEVAKSVDGVVSVQDDLTVE